MRARAAVLTFALIVTLPGPLSTSAQQPAAPQVSPAERAAQLKAKLAEAEKTAGPDDPATATVLNELAIFHYGQGEFAAAEPLLRRALQIREKALGAGHAQTAQALNNLAQVLQELGRYAEVEPLLERALAMYEKTQGPEHNDVANALNNLASLYRLTGNYPKAEPLYLRALAIREKTTGPESPATAVVLNNLGLMHHQAGALEKARPLLERSLAIREKAAPESPDVARALNNLAIVAQEEGDVDRAEPLYRRSAALYEKAAGRRHPLTTQVLNNLAVVLFLKGDHAAAGPLYEEAIANRTAALGSTHPEIAYSLTSQAIFLDATGRLDEAVAKQTQAAEIIEGSLDLVLATGSEAQKTRFMETFTENTDITISMHRQSGPRNAAAQRMAFETILRRKGRVLDAVSGSFQALRDRTAGESRELLDKLASTRAGLARLVLRGPGNQPPAAFAADVKRIEDALHELERQISARSANFLSLTQRVDIAAVRRQLPSNGVLVEFAVYRPFNNRVARRNERFSAPHYAAYILRSTGDPVSVDLGEVAPIDREIDHVRRALSSPKGTSLKPAAQRLHALLMAPLVPAIGDSPRLFVAPDGALNLLPFAALMDDTGRYVVETREISYLTSGRDLLQQDKRATASTRALIMADPQFDAGLPSAQSADSRAFDLSRARFTPLPGTATEAKALAALVPGADVLTGSSATEGALKAVRGPRILHLATHGFFLGSGAQGPETSRLLKHEPASPAGVSPATQGALLRSGLAFAGANQRNTHAAEDGILTALEASSLDLWGTRMAVLSACETGVGEARRGEGVYGLRRALVIAGSESQVMSLWQVSDQGTRVLMTDFYTSLKTGRARSAALRDVQVRMLKSKSRSHPYYWASFILSGADGPIVFQ